MSKYYTEKNDRTGEWSVKYEELYIATFQNIFDANQYLTGLESGRIVNYEAETKKDAIGT